jgi:hypothetical protein
MLNGTYIVEELEEVNIVSFRSEVLFEEEVDGALEHERVVDGDVRDSVL